MLPEHPTIARNRKLPEAMDYRFLRQKGIEYITQLASQIWTDHNIHDPGITTLEVLCYAITELTYRTRFSTRDILARKKGENIKDFFTAREVLTCNPLTPEDIRLVIIDCQGVQNGWIEEFKEPAFYYRCNQEDRGYRMSVTEEEGFKGKPLGGLYIVSLELEEDDELGDLNSNIMEWQIKKDKDTIPVRIITPPFEVEFPLFREQDSILQLLYRKDDVKGFRIERFDEDKNWFELKIEFNGGLPRAVSAGLFRVLLPPHIRVDVRDELRALFENSDADSFFHLYIKRLEKILSIMKGVYCRLHSYRNLCEDYVRFRIVKSQEVSICADIEITPQADPEEVLARIYFEVDRFLAPPVRFYSLKEMLEKGKTVDEIFEGFVGDHGFVDRRELKDSELKDTIHVSDLYRIILTIDGVIAVKELVVTNYINGVPATSGERWCVRLDGKYHLNLRQEWSRVIFYKRGVPFRADTKQVEGLFRQFRAEYARPKLAGPAPDLDVPTGEDLRLDRYCSIQNDFPLVYHTGKEGLPSTMDATRRAQAKQFKAFLMFFDQLLANYLAQLHNVKNLLSVSAPVESTCAVQPLYNSPEDTEQDDFPGVENLLVDFIEFVRDRVSPEEFESLDLDNPDSLKHWWLEFRKEENSYLKKLKEYAETRQSFLERRNRFLDHLIARFAESFTDYAMVMYTIVTQAGHTEKLRMLEEMMRDKEDFLKSYPEISRDRARAFRYRCLSDQDGLWNSTNVAGLKKRLSRLLGIQNYQRRTLGYCEEDVNRDFRVERRGDNSYRVDLHVDIDRDRHRYREQALKTETYRARDLKTARKKARELIEHIIWQAPLGENYRIRKNGRWYRLELAGTDGRILAWCRRRFKTEKEAEEYRDGIINYIRNKYFREGFHIFEHILLRPVDNVSIEHRDVEEGFVQECMDEENCRCPVRDFYSFRITVVFPAWSLKFRDMRFREFAEELVRLETPAHILPRICWVGPCEMKELEEIYREWLQMVSEEIPERRKLQKKTMELVQKLNNLTSVYPAARLSDCTDPENKNFTILNQTIMGTLKGEEQ